MNQATLSIAAIAIGGASGAVIRYSLANYFNSTIQIHHTVHIGTLLVNVIGSFAMGLLYVFILEKELIGSHWHSILMVGFLAAFTTFSSFSVEAINFFERGHPGLALVYVLASVVFCITAAWVAMVIARGIF